MSTQIEIAAKLFESGQLSEADSVCRQILEQTPDHSTALHLRGVIAYQSHNYVESTRFLDAANKLVKNNTSLMFALAASHENNKNYKPAIELYRNICQLNPENSMAHRQLAVVLEKNQQFNEAINEYQALNKIIKNDPDILLSLAQLYANTSLENNISNNSNNDKKSKDYAQQLAELRPTKADTWNNIGLVYKTIKLTDEAISCFNQALVIDEKHTKSRLNLASILQDKGDCEEAKTHYLHVVERTENNSEDTARAHYNLALIYLGEGDFSSAWNHLRHRPKLFTDMPSLADLNNKRLLILGEEGLGDELMFIRFIPLLKNYGVSIEYIGNPKLLPLLKNVSSIDALHSSLPETDSYDYCISAMDLPSILNMNKLETAPPVSLTADKNLSNPDLEQVIRKINSQAIKTVLGITWRAGAVENTSIEKSKTNKFLSKSIPLDKLCILLKDFKGTIVVLQRNPMSDEIDYLKTHLSENIIDASSINNDLPLMLVLLTYIDHYFGVSNTNMHLYGSLGKTADVIIPFPGEWRWMYKTNSSPWYPHFNVIRQAEHDNWDNVIKTKPGYIQHG